LSYGKYLGRVGIGRHIAQYIFLSKILSVKKVGQIYEGYIRRIYTEIPQKILAQKTLENGLF
jgi:hypothetical protein